MCYLKVLWAKTAFLKSLIYDQQKAVSVIVEHWTSAFEEGTTQTGKKERHLPNQIFNMSGEVEVAAVKVSKTRGWPESTWA